jgi:hypothetical protein
MVVKFLDPYKDDKYGRLRGDKSDTYFKVIFAEAKIYKTDDAYIIAGQVSAYEGVTRSYKPELPLEPGLCALPIYGTEYEIRRKDGEAWVSDKIVPSAFELSIYYWIKEHESIWVGDNVSVKGTIGCLPDGMFASLDEPARANLLIGNVLIENTTASGNLPAYEVPKTYGGSRGGGGRSYGLQPSEKFAFIKKQLAADIINPGFNEEMSLVKLIEQMYIEHPMENDISSTYFDCLLACVQ